MNVTHAKRETRERRATNGRLRSEWSDSSLEMRCVALYAHHERLGAGEQELLPSRVYPESMKTVLASCSAVGFSGFWAAAAHEIDPVAKVPPDR